jgi:hypothetical protein
MRSRFVALLSRARPVRAVRTGAWRLALALPGPARAPWRSSAPRWRHPRTVVALNLLFYAFALSLVALLVMALLAFLAGRPIGPLARTEQSCRDISFSCGLFGGAIFAVVPAAITYLFLLRLPRQRYLRRARTAPHLLAEPGRRMNGSSVGSRGVWGLLVENLLDRERRRPQIIIGAAGSGKTTLLIQLTSVLARSGAVPIPIQLADAEARIDLRELARRTFIRESRVSEADASKTWEQLLREDQVVVLADGLDEALPDSDPDIRDSLVGFAIQEAQNSGLPLVVFSRPSGSVTAFGASVLALEPLPADVAFAHLATWSNSEQERLEWLVERAGLGAPSYLHIAAELERNGLFDYPGIDTRGADRIELRRRLALAWLDALVDGRITGIDGLAPEARERTLVYLSVFACIALWSGSRRVSFDAVDDALASLPTLRDVVEDRVGVVRVADAWLAASRGVGLGLVTVTPSGVRFSSPVAQGCLAAILMTAVLDDDAYLGEALAQPCDALLLALVMFSRMDESDGLSSEGEPWRPWLQERLVFAMPGHDDVTALALLTTAIELGARDHGAPQLGLWPALVSAWPSGSRDQAVVYAKWRLVQPLADAARSSQAADAYQALYDACCEEDVAAVRSPLAHELGLGGDPAFEAVRPSLEAVQEELEGASAHALLYEPQRRFELQGWLLPLFFGSVTGENQQSVVTLLEAWLTLVPGLAPSLEAAIGQGMRWEANRVPPPSGQETREYLLERMLDTMDAADFWLTSLRLIQALGLAALSSERLHSDAVGKVHGLLYGTPREGEHPFVSEARQLALRAVRSGDAARFMWLDERHVLARMGGSTGGEPRGRSGALIDSSDGWTTLHRRAQHLLGDVVVLLNLAERHVEGRDREARLRRTYFALPSCLVEDRCPYLRPHLSRADAARRLPGEDCAVGCPVGLCPSPPWRPYSDLGEAFCRRLKGSLERRRPWQATSRTELRAFWTEMEDRARR